MKGPPKMSNQIETQPLPSPQIYVPLPLEGGRDGRPGRDGRDGGATKLVWWLLSTVMIIVMALAGNWATGISTANTDHEKRLAALEKNGAVQQVQLQVMHDQLEKVDLKLDRVLDNQEKMKVR